MKLLRRFLNGLLWAGGMGGAMIAAPAVFVTKLMVSPPRQRFWAVPSDLGLPYEDVQFPAQDGLRLAGWFIPAPASSNRSGATVTLVHGWLWNRLGDAAEDFVANIIGSTPVDLLRLAHALHHDGFHVLMFDWRNHGESAESPPVTFGLHEANDLLGALEYLHQRDDVDNNQLGVIAFSSGSNLLLYTLPQTPQIKAAIAVQPITPNIFARRFAHSLMGSLGNIVMPPSLLLYQLAGGPTFDSLQPKAAIARGYPTPLLYIQGDGDQWGSVADVREIAAATVGAEAPLIVSTTHRYDGYQYIIDHPEIATAFFDKHFNHS